MNGIQMGALNLFFVNKGSAFNTNWVPPMSLVGRNYGDQWIGAAFTISTNTEKQIVLEAVRGDYVTSFIAVDDISVTQGSCETPGGCSNLEK